MSNAQDTISNSKISNSKEIKLLEKRYGELKDAYKDKVPIQNYYNELLTKILVISSASFFEKKITEFIEEQICKSNQKDIIRSFSKACIERKYYAWFNFSAESNKYTGIYQFLTYFGKAFKENIQEIIRANKSREQENISSFIKIGGLRNKLVHSDFMFNNSLGEITFDEIYKDHESSINCWDFLMKEIENASIKPTQI